MIAVMHPSASPEDIEHVVEVLRLHNLKAQISQREERTVIGVIGERFAEPAAVWQIGARNMQNFPLLKEVGRSARPCMLKRGLSATIEEWLMAAEYIMHAGKPHMMLCDRGIRTF